ncbi:MAG TPA: hypothetical protein PKC91_05815 [Ignavibacteria bacterium]|nr:hypothetical protein [Ignavibacteria bacterium]
MKIDKPTYKELKEYYFRNKNYFDKLSSYYLLNDPEYYNNNFRKIEDKYKFSTKHSGKWIIHSAYITLATILVIFYLLPFHFYTDYREYDIREYSLVLISTDLPDYEIGMNKFKKKQYLIAREYFLKVTEIDMNYSNARHMIELCDGNLDKDGISVNR